MSLVGCDVETGCWGSFIYHTCRLPVAFICMEYVGSELYRKDKRGVTSVTLLKRAVCILVLQSARRPKHTTDIVWRFGLPITYYETTFLLLSTTI